MTKIDEAIASLSDPTEKAWLTGLEAEAVVRNAHRFYDFMDEQGQPSDSYTRELAFAKAAEHLGIAYDVLYNAWLGQKPLCTYADPGTITPSSPYGRTTLTLKEA